jgi:hypothetical protein
VVSRLEYGIQIWGPYIGLAAFDNMDDITTSTFRRGLRLHTYWPTIPCREGIYSTSNILVRLDLCNTPSRHHAAECVIRYWNKRVNEIKSQVYTSFRQWHSSLPMGHSDNWFRGARQMFADYNLDNYFDTFTAVPYAVLCHSFIRKWHDYELAYISERGGRLDHLIPLVKAKVYAACTAVSKLAQEIRDSTDSSLRVLSIYNAKTSLYLDKELWHDSADRQKQIRAAICLRSGYAPACCYLCRDAGVRSPKYENPLKHILLDCNQAESWRLANELEADIGSIQSDAIKGYIANHGLLLEISFLTLNLECYPGLMDLLERDVESRDALVKALLRYARGVYKAFIVCPDTRPPPPPPLPPNTTPALPQAAVTAVVPPSSSSSSSSSSPLRPTPCSASAPSEWLSAEQRSGDNIFAPLRAEITARAQQSLFGAVGTSLRRSGRIAARCGHSDQPLVPSVPTT